MKEILKRLEAVTLSLREEDDVPLVSPGEESDTPKTVNNDEVYDVLAVTLRRQLEKVDKAIVLNLAKDIRDNAQEIVRRSKREQPQSKRTDMAKQMKSGDSPAPTEN